ncbi:MULTISPECIES: 4Fe-4S dicluster domain-containing protein [unclassified Acutalibacter]|jgi:2-oxoglutarate ferredoxin oxidoreductase subunit delta|uniref:4Fe-4S dicluster domain-containing protein n=1 Tax=unclassified Acutalibacter TaxID=2620728 RepID=UPI0013733467|nr:MULTISPECIES: 4Fe-4S binding protein [unclassified Acutalibacter]MCI9224419.1 4Fe-4S binding protein [Acutalibacter sp.]NBJ89971.1 4Fe-4S dicluster domain-containing protein [Acutalibacter sp. 1XD8-36]
MPKITVDESVCKGCGLCANACPLKIISLDTGRLNLKGYHPARLMEPGRCTGCASCAAMCPDTAITVEK